MSVISILLLITLLFYVFLNLKLLSTSQSAVRLFVSILSFFHYAYTHRPSIDAGPSLIVFIIILHYYPLSIAYNGNDIIHTHSTQHNIVYSTLNLIHVGTYNNSHMNGLMVNVRYFPPMYYGSV